MASLSVRELCAKIGFGTIAGKIWGENTKSAQKFLAVHGYLDNAGTFDPLMEKFVTKDRCVVCMEFPGHGLSSKFPKGIPYSPASEIQSMRSVIKYLGWEKYNLIGHSMGGMRSQEYALCWADEVEAVIVLDSLLFTLEYSPRVKVLGALNSPYESFGRQLDDYIKFDKEYHGNAREHTWQELSDRWLAAVPELRDEDFCILMKRGSTQLENGKYIYNRDPALLNKLTVLLKHSCATVEAVYKKSAHRNLLILLAKDGILKTFSPQIQTVNFMDLWVKVIPQATVKEIEGTHFVHMQEPGYVSQIINEFLTSLSSEGDNAKTLNIPSRI